MGPIAEAVFAAMIALAPPERADLPSQLGVETVTERRARYAVIAYEIADAVEHEAPLPGMSRSKTAALLVGLSFAESAWDADADLGPCLGRRCDSGRAATIFQIQAPAEDRARLFADRPYAIRRALGIARRSLGACHGLSGYTSGTCSSLIGQASARRREQLSDRIHARFFVARRE
jgi:hypothetical protein